MACDSDGATLIVDCNRAPVTRGQRKGPGSGLRRIRHAPATTPPPSSLRSLPRRYWFEVDETPRTEWSGFGSGMGDFANPSGVAIATNGCILVAGTVNHRIKAIAPSPQVLAGWGREGDAPRELRYPHRVTTDLEGRSHVAEFGDNRVLVHCPDGQSILSGRPGNDPGDFDWPPAVAMGSEGTMPVLHTDRSRIQRFTKSGEPMGVLGHAGNEAGEVLRPDGIAVSRHGTVAGAHPSPGAKRAAHTHGGSIAARCGLAIIHLANRPRATWMIRRSSSPA